MFFFFAEKYLPLDSIYRDDLQKHLSDNWLILLFYWPLGDLNVIFL